MEAQRQAEGGEKPGLPDVVIIPNCSAEFNQQNPAAFAVAFPDGKTPVACQISLERLMKLHQSFQCRGAGSGRAGMGSSSSAITIAPHLQPSDATALMMRQMMETMLNMQQTHLDMLNRGQQHPIGKRLRHGHGLHG